MKEGVKDVEGMVLWNMVMNCLRKKKGLVGIVRRKMYVCDSKEVIVKDRECLGNKKGGGCESGGFVGKIMKVWILREVVYEECY